MSRREVTERKRLEGTKTGVPSWVRKLVERQDRSIQELEREVERLTAELAGDGSSTFGTGTSSDPDRRPMAGRYTDAVSWVERLDADGPKRDSFQLDFIDQGDHVEVRCSSWHGVALFPTASNVVLVKKGRTK